MTHNNLLLVTGASSGIGREISKKLCNEGYEVILTSRSSNKLQSVYTELSELGYKVHAIECDLRNEKDIDNLFKVSNKIGFVDCVICNAGIGKFSSVQNTSIEDWDEQMDTNLRAPFLLTKFFINRMIEEKTGKFIFINSVAGKYAHSFSNSSGYIASKYGLRGFADSLRTEVRKDNIKVVSIYPGAIDTSFWNSIDVDFDREEMLSTSDLAETIYHTIVSPNSSVIEDVVVRRTAGDF